MIVHAGAAHPSRAVARAANGMIATPHPQATLAGIDVLRRGGNAVDAAIAANAVLAVVYGAMCGLGGDAFWLVYDPKGRNVVGYNGSGRTPKAASLDRLRGPNGPVLPQRGALSVTVPGAVRSWADVGRAHGTRDLDELLAPAERCARDGYVVSDICAEYFAANAELLESDREAERVFLGHGLPRAGEIVRNADLAATLAAIRAGGPDAFYCDRIAERIVRTLNAQGNSMSLDDLAGHRTERTVPLRIAWHGRELLAHPPNSQGAAMLLVMGMLAADGNAAEPLWHHLAIEAVKVAIRERNAHFADPVFSESGVAAKLEPQALAAWRATLDPARALPSVSAGDAGDTIFLCAVDAYGGAVSLIQSLYMSFGSGIVARDTGVLLHNRGAYFSLQPGHPNVYAGGKRPLHTLSPPMVLRDGEPELVFGTMGGDGQPQIQVQLLHYIYERGLNVQQALDMPRWIFGRHPGAGPSGAADAEGVLIESRFDPRLAAYLRERGHRLSELGPYRNEMGHAHAIAIDRRAGTFAGGGDPRADSLTLGY